VGALTGAVGRVGDGRFAMIMTGLGARTAGARTGTGTGGVGAVGGAGMQLDALVEPSGETVPVGQD
jgi:hypothetical protein